jgi:hypothetical protein
VKLLSEQDSLQLFCQHAYNSDSPPAAEEEQVKRLVERCGRLPMALEVGGRHLGQRSNKQGFFTDLEKELTSVYAAGRPVRLDGQRTLFAALRLSWNALDAKEQETLLDIAWFLKGQPWELVEMHSGYGVLERLCQFGLVKDVLMTNSLGAVQRIAAVHDTVSDFCSSSVGIGRHPRRIGLQTPSPIIQGDEVQQVRCHMLFNFLSNRCACKVITAGAHTDRQPWTTARYVAPHRRRGRGCSRLPGGLVAANKAQGASDGGLEVGGCIAWLAANLALDWGNCNTAKPALAADGGWHAYARGPGPSGGSLTSPCCLALLEAVFVLPRSKSSLFQSRGLK